MDYGKFKYREAKKQHEAKLKLKQIQVKEVKFRPGTDEGDYKIKLRNLDPVPRGRRQGEDHACASAAARWRTRNSACGCWSASRTDLEPHGVVEQFPKMEGRQMVMLLAPKKSGYQASRIPLTSPKPVSRGDKPAKASPPRQREHRRGQQIRKDGTCRR